jgi:mannose-6-phosphate isomerase
MDLYPLRFQPKLLPKIWGGQRLKAWSKSLPAGQALGESWEIYDRPGDSALVASGPLKGQSLQELIKEFGPRLLGQREFEKGHAFFPLMLKLIDANEALSVQVHPDDEQALRMVGPHELGKTEMWLVLEAAQGASVVAGFKPGVTREAFSAALKEGKLEGVLQEFPVKAGDRIFIPAGRVHAIGKGCLMAEVQQNSDTTYRVYDYGRLENGKPRDLHVKEALECIRFDAAMASLPKLAPPGPVTCDYFHVELIEAGKRQALRSPEPSFQILLGIQGRARIHSASATEELGPGDALLIPASVDAGFEALEAGTKLLLARP